MYPSIIIHDLLRVTFSLAGHGPFAANGSAPHTLNLNFIAPSSQSRNSSADKTVCQAGNMMSGLLVRLLGPTISVVLQMVTNCNQLEFCRAEMLYCPIALNLLTISLKICTFEGFALVLLTHMIHLSINAGHQGS